jgi:general stress protein YciG
MGYLYQPKLKSGGHSAIWWAKWYVDGRPTRESTGTDKKRQAETFLKDREGRAARGEAVLPRAGKVRYDEAAADLREHYRTTGSRELDEAEGRLTHLGAFFTGYRLAAIGPAEVTRYVAKRQAEPTQMIAHRDGATHHAAADVERQHQSRAGRAGAAAAAGVRERQADPPAAAPQAEGGGPAARLFRTRAVRGGAPAPEPGPAGGLRHRLHVRVADAE